MNLNEKNTKTKQMLIRYDTEKNSKISKKKLMDWIWNEIKEILIGDRGAKISRIFNSFIMYL